MRPDGSELRRLLSPVTPEEFLARHWNRAPLYIPGSADKFAGLGFDLAAFAAAIAPRVPLGSLELKFIGANGRLVAGPSRPEDYRVADGITLQAYRICDRLERLAAFCAGIKIGLSLPGAVTMTGYAVPSSRGFRTHFDWQPNFILQIEGSKRWRFSPEPEVRWPPVNVPQAGRVDEMMDRYPFLKIQYPPDEGDFLEQVLSPGDVLFLPAGIWHQTRSLDDSLSITMTCIPRTAADIVEDTVRAALSRSEAWRQNVPPVLTADATPGRLPAVVEGFLESRLSELKTLVASLEAKDLYQSWFRGIASFESPFGAAPQDGVPALAAGDVLTVSRDLGLRFVTNPDAQTVSLYHLDQRIDLAAAALPLVEALAGTSSFRAGRASEWLGEAYGWEDVAPLLQEMVRAGILRVAR